MNFPLLHKSLNRESLLENYHNESIDFKLNKIYLRQTGFTLPKRKFSCLRQIPLKFRTNPRKLAKYGYLLKQIYNHESSAIQYIFN